MPDVTAWPLHINSVRVAGNKSTKSDFITRHFIGAQNAKTGMMLLVVVIVLV